MVFLRDREILEFADELTALELRKGWSPGLFAQSTINGYHAHRKMPLAGTRIPLDCILEPTNPYDSDAIKIMVPSINRIPAAYHLLLTKPPPRPQRVSDVAGHVVGRVPLDASKIIAPRLRDGDIVRMNAFVTGNRRNDGPIPGGGLKLECFYRMEFTDPAVQHQVKGALLALKPDNRSLSRN